MLLQMSADSLYMCENAYTLPFMYEHEKNQIQQIVHHSWIKQGEKNSLINKTKQNKKE